MDPLGDARGHVYNRRSSTESSQPRAAVAETSDSPAAQFSAGGRPRRQPPQRQSQRHTQASQVPHHQSNPPSLSAGKRTSEPEIDLGAPPARLSHAPYAQNPPVSPGYDAGSSTRSTRTATDHGGHAKFGSSSGPYVRRSIASTIGDTVTHTTFEQSTVKPPKEDHVRRLKAQGFSFGLARALAENAQLFDHRIWVIDNSGSMQIGDGHRIAETGKKDDLKAIPSTRWEEIQDTVKYHAEMAGLLETPTVFKLLNDPGATIGPQEFSVATHGESMVGQEIQAAITTMRMTKPGGVTPLTRHIWEIQQTVSDMSLKLVKEGKKVVIVLATDGLPTDEQGYGGEYITDEFIRALRSLEDLPIWLVVRLCTDEEPITRFYNNLDGQLELSLEVLDDFIGEAKEVHKYNKWLTYALPMHRCRELGYHDRLFDLIDERALTRGEIRDFCCLLFGVDNLDTIPDPGADWPGFTKIVLTLLKKEQLQWNPITKKMSPWISLKQLQKTYGDKSKCICM